MIEGQGGRDKWVNVGDLTPTGLMLAYLEPGETVEVKGTIFEVQTITLDPPSLVIVPRNESLKPGKAKN